MQLIMTTGDWLTPEDLEVARQVQARLLPQGTPRLSTLDCGGFCLPARCVGGDFYDFLDLGPERVGLVLGDVSGKGVSAALMMASLQALLRSHCYKAVDDVRTPLRSVNRLFYQCTAPHHFATLFFGDYEDAARRLRYVNCGHNPPLLVREGGRIERLEPTATVLGLFDDWDCGVDEVTLGAGDTLLLYSDGVVEAKDPLGQEFGEKRLIESLAHRLHLPAEAAAQALAAVVEKFSGHVQGDDLTLLVARAEPRTAARASEAEAARPMRPRVNGHHSGPVIIQTCPPSDTPCAPLIARTAAPCS